MSYAIARREGNRIQANFVGGSLEIIHEADNGFLVLGLPRRKHWKAGRPDFPVRYSLGLLLAGDEAVEARRHTLYNSAHLAAMPCVLVLIGEMIDAGRDWRSVRRKMIERADHHGDDA